VVFRGGSASSSTAQPSSTASRASRRNRFSGLNVAPRPLAGGAGRPIIAISYNTSAASSVIVAFSRREIGQLAFALLASSPNFALSMPGIRARVVKCTAVTVQLSFTRSNVNAASVSIASAVKPLLFSMNDSAIVKQPACAAAINSSGFVPLPSPNRAANEYGVSLSVPLCTDSVPLPSLTVPCQRAFALRCIVCLRNGVELQFQDGIEFQVYRVARPCAGRRFRLPSIMPKPRVHQFDTLTLHAGAVPDPTTGARA